MKKFLAFMLVAVFAFISPRIVQGITFARLQVKDSITGAPVAGAQVYGPYYTYALNCTLRNFLGVFNAVTDSNGEIQLGGIFNGTMQNAIVFSYQVDKDGYLRYGWPSERTIWLDETSTVNLNPIPHCGNGLCEPQLGENPLTCPIDCGHSCGNGICEPQYGENPRTCPVDCRGPICGNGICERHLGENERNCRIDCGRVVKEETSKPAILKLKTVK